MQIGSKTLDEWVEFAKRDDCLDRMLPSDLRQIVGKIAKWKGIADERLEQIYRERRAYDNLHRDINS